MSAYIEERQGGKKCGFLRCKYFSILGEQNCFGEYKGGPAVLVCADYVPENVEFDDERDRDVYYRQHLHRDDYEKNGIVKS